MACRVPERNLGEELLPMITYANVAFCELCQYPIVRCLLLMREHRLISDLLPRTNCWGTACANSSFLKIR